MAFQSDIQCPYHTAPCSDSCSNRPFLWQCRHVPLCRSVINFALLVLVFINDQYQFSIVLCSDPDDFHGLETLIL